MRCLSKYLSLGDTPVRVQLWLMLFLWVGTVLVCGQEQATEPLPQAHAHNDYRHPRPLFDAIARGFCSVEADVYLVDGKLLVGHNRFELRPDRTLQKLYLDPLRKLARQNNGQIYPNGPTMTLLVDIKANGEEVYAVLRTVLASYKDILCSVADGQYQQRAVQIVISGDRPIRAIASDDIRYAGIDGRIADLESQQPAHLMPLISDRWSSHFSWRGVGEIPADQREKLQSIVARAHAAGRRVRFWATPEEPNLWSELLSAGVDHINTDQLDALRQHLSEQ